MYKALFELSADRAEFLSRLFSRRKPAGVGAGATPAALFDAIRRRDLRPRSRRAIDDNLKAILAQLERRHGFAARATRIAPGSATSTRSSFRAART